MLLTYWLKYFTVGLVTCFNQIKIQEIKDTVVAYLSETLDYPNYKITTQF